MAVRPIRNETKVNSKRTRLTFHPSFIHHLIHERKSISLLRRVFVTNDQTNNSFFFLKKVLRSKHIHFQNQIRSKNEQRIFSKNTLYHLGGSSPKRKEQQHLIRINLLTFFCQ